MKKTLLLLPLLFVFLVGKTQDARKPFEDALAISRSLAVPGNKDYVSVLIKYEPDITRLSDFIANNMFLREHAGLSTAGLSTAETSPADIKQIQGAAGGFAFIPQHQAIDALGTFIAKRFKEELNITFIRKFRDKLEGQADLKAMMPITHKFLMENEPYNYTSFLESLRAALKQDLESLPTNIMALTRNHKAELVKSLTSDGYVGLIMGLEAVNSFLKRNSSARMLLDLTSVAETSEITNAHFRFSVNLLNASVLELMDGVTDDWYSDNAMREVFRQENTLLFLGLFYEKHKTLFSDTTVAEGLPIYMEHVMRSYNVIRSYQAEVKLIRTTTGELTVSEVLQYLDLTINAADELLNIDDIFGPSYSTAIISERVIPYARRTVAIIRDIDEKEYANAFVNTVGLAAELLPSQTAFRKEFVRYGNFAVSIVTAENSDAMVVALESAALPVGSYQIKRESFFNISLNAYAGGFGGIEYIKARGDVTLPEDVHASAGVAGFAAPVGVAFSWGTRASFDKRHADRRTFDNGNRVLTGTSWSLFISALDLGAVTAFRLQNDNAETLPELTFQNVLAPGAYLIHGFRKLPLSIGIGAQYGPQVRTIADLGSEQDLLALWNARLFITVDIPLFNLYTKNEK